MIYQAARLWKALQNTTQHPKRPRGQQRVLRSARPVKQ